MLARHTYSNLIILWYRSEVQYLMPSCDVWVAYRVREAALTSIAFSLQSKFFDRGQNTFHCSENTFHFSHNCLNCSWISIAVQMYGWHIGSEKPLWPRLCYNRSQKIFTAVRTLFTAVRTLSTAVKAVSTAVNFQSQLGWFWLRWKTNLIEVKNCPITGQLIKV